MGIMDKVLADSKKAKEEAEERKNGFQGRNIDFGEKLSLKMEQGSGEFRIGRLMGEPEYAQVSTIYDDKGKFMSVNLPPKPGNESHIIWKALSLIGAKDWNKKFKTPEGYDDAPYIYKDQYPDLFNKVMHNDKDPFYYQGKKIMDKGWYPQNLMLWNIIDRMPCQKFDAKDRKREKPLGEHDYCKENKKCKIISKDGFQMGVARSSFTKQFDFLAEKYPTKSDNPDLDVLGYDIVLERTDDNSSPIRMSKADSDVTAHTKYISNSQLNDEEKEYALVDLKALAEVTPNVTLHKRLGETLNKLFVAFGETKFYEKWLEQVEIEKAEYAAKKKAEAEAAKEQEGSDANTPAETPVEEKVETDVKEEIKSEPVQEQAEPEVKKRERVAATDEYDPIKKFLPYLKNEDRAKIVSVDSEGKVTWEKSLGGLYECFNASCNLHSPDGIAYCAKCGTDFSE